MTAPTSASPTEDTALWTHWPMRDKWPASIAPPLSVAAVVVAVHVSFRSPLFDAVAFVLLCLSLLKYFAPTRMRADADGITVRFCLRSKRYAWEEFSACRDTRDGLMLSLRRSVSGESAEVFLPVPPGCDEAREYVRARIG